MKPSPPFDYYDGVAERRFRSRPGGTVLVKRSARGVLSKTVLRALLVASEQFGAPIVVTQGSCALLGDPPRDHHKTTGIVDIRTRGLKRRERERLEFVLADVGAKVYYHSVGVTPHFHVTFPGHRRCHRFPEGEIGSVLSQLGLQGEKDMHVHQNKEAGDHSISWAQYAAIAGMGFAVGLGSAAVVKGARAARAWFKKRAG